MKSKALHHVTSPQTVRIVCLCLSLDKLVFHIYVNKLNYLNCYIDIALSFLYVITAVSRKRNPFTWYNEMLEKYPIRTKCITSGGTVFINSIIGRGLVIPGLIYRTAGHFHTTDA